MIAYEISLQLARRLGGVTVIGILLIDSPSPINHVPLPDSVIDHLMFSDKQSADEIKRIIKIHFKMSARMLSTYHPQETNGQCPPIVLLRSTEDFVSEGIADVPAWLLNRKDPESTTKGWMNLANRSLKVMDIPGHHFQPFLPPYVCFP